MKLCRSVSQQKVYDKRSTTNGSRQMVHDKRVVIRRPELGQTKESARREKQTKHLAFSRRFLLYEEIAVSGNRCFPKQLLWVSVKDRQKTCLSNRKPSVSIVLGNICFWKQM